VLVLVQERVRVQERALVRVLVLAQ